jgi:NADPH-dependent glutamate synthase beta subunit-like oxidoreductase
VTIKDANGEPGGMMCYGIPKYRLPRDILDAEVNRILDMGVILERGARVTDIPSRAGPGLRRRVRGRRRPHRPPRLHRCTTWKTQTPPMLGRQVAVYGGGNTAMDAARTSRRLGAAEAVVVYRRTREQMPAHDTEVQEALEDAPRRDRLPQPTGEFEELEADCLVLALGQNADLSVLQNVPGVTFSGNVTDVGPDLMTGRPGLFAGGDMVPSERTVAVGHGKKAAQHRRLAARWQLHRCRQTPARRVRRPQHLVLRRRPGHRAAHARGRPADHYVRRGDQRAQ